MFMNVYSLLVAMSLMFAGNSLQLMIVLSRAEIEGFTDFQIAQLACTYFVGFFVGCRFLPKVLSSFGHIRFFSAVASVSSASVIAYLLYIEPNFWALLRFMSGFCISGMLLTAESWLTSMSKGIGSMKLFSAYRSIDICFTIIGLLLIKVASVKEIDLFAISSMALSFSLVPIALTTNKAPNIRPQKTGPILETLKLSTHAFIGCGVAGLSIGSVWGFISVESMKLTGNPKFVGYFLATYLFGGFISQSLISRLANFLGYRDMLTWFGFLAACIAFLGTTLTDVSNSYVMLAIAFGFGATSIPIYSLGVAHANEKAELTNYDDFITTSSNLLLVMGIGAALGPFLTSSIAKTIGGGHGIYLTASFTFGAYFLVCLKKSKQTSLLQVEDQSDYIPINANVVHPEIDPRS